MSHIDTGTPANKTATAAAAENTWTGVIVQETGLLRRCKSVRRSLERKIGAGRVVHALGFFVRRSDSSRVRSELLAFLDSDDPSPRRDADAGASVARWRLRREDVPRGRDQRRTPPLSTKPVLPALHRRAWPCFSQRAAIGITASCVSSITAKRTELVKRTKL